MVDFTRKKLKKIKRVCFRLKEARTIAGFSVEEISKKTHIEKIYIEALESCNFNKLPAGEIYRKKIIKKYLNAIDIEAETYLLQYSSEEADYEKSDIYHPCTVISKKYFQNLPSLLRFAMITTVAIVLVSYLGIQINKIVRPPVLVIQYPENGYVTQELSLEVRGQTGKDVHISINGTNVANTEDGGFAEKINLSPGINTITIDAQRKHGKTTTEVRNVILQEERSLVGFANSINVNL